ncbi:transcription antitermination factor NusB [Micrococcales bacterium 31B]|nr:transcription antitermination factor NusB [Micrococcales bacterium 31B]
MSDKPAKQSARGKARKRALDILFEADQRGMYLDDMVAERRERAGHPAPLPAFALQILEGVIAHGRRIDDLIDSHSVDWPLDRMPAVDRAIMRLGVWEILYTDTPGRVVMSEAVALANDLSTDNSGRFVNGVLGRINDLKPSLSELSEVAEPQHAAAVSETDTDGDFDDDFDDFEGAVDGDDADDADDADATEDADDTDTDAEPHDSTGRD